MKFSNEYLIKTPVLIGCILILPFIVFYWMLPFLSDLTLGNDYAVFPIQHQIELMFSLKMGSFPLYVPGFAGGQSASALTLGQIFHPISYLSSFLPGYWEGKALEWNTFFRLLSLGLAHLSIFLLIRRIGIDALMGFILSFITVYNLRMLDLFRYGASLESWTGHLFLCAAIGFYYLKPNKWKGPLFIIGATYWLICSGHPQMAYYGVLGASLFALVIPYFVAIMNPEKQVALHDAFRFWLRVGIYGGIGIMLSSAYILPFYFDFIFNNAGRVSRDYLWADGYRDTFFGTINNFFQPLYSRVNSGFGGSSLILIAVLVPILRFFRVHIPSIIWAIWCLLLAAFLYMQGGRTWVHFLAWKYLPFASSFRIAGRISMIMPIFFLLLLMWVFDAKAFSQRFFGREVQISPQSVLSLAALQLFVIYLLIPGFITANTTMFSATSIRQIPSWVEGLYFGTALAALAVLVVHGYPGREKFAAGIALCMITCIQVILVLHYGTWVETKQATPSLSQLQAHYKESLNYPMSTGYGLSTAVVDRQVNRSFLEPFLGKIYNRYRVAENNDMAYVLMQESRSPDQVTIENYLPADNSNSVSQVKVTHDRVALKFSSFNRLVFEVQSSHPGFFGLSYPFTGNWKALVNHQHVQVYRANGAEHVVEIPSGISDVEFCYSSPAALWGMGISCITFILTGFIISRRFFGKGKMWLLAVSAVLVIGIGVFFIWYRSLYTGNNLETVYVWQATPTSTPPNLAYGKKTNMSSLKIPSYPYYRNSGQAVDGSRAPESGFITAMENRPWWIVDLNEIKSIGSINIYEGQERANVNQRPIVVALSCDQKKWRTVRMISEPASDRPLSLEFKIPEKARYILIRASGICHFSLEEVEIYPPATAEGLKSDELNGV